MTTAQAADAIDIIVKLFITVQKRLSDASCSLKWSFYFLNDVNDANGPVHIVFLRVFFYFI